MSEEEGNYQVSESVERTAIPPFVAPTGYIPSALEPSQSGGLPGSAGSGKADDRGAAHRLKHVDLFSGIGGFALAARWAGMETIAFSEIDEYAIKILERHWPGVPNYGDIRSFPAIECDIITGGFPCQPFSVAGPMLGRDDDRFLWPAMLDAISRCKPKWVVGENVTNIANMVLSDCLDELANQGYRGKAFDIPACAVGLPTMERHIWIVAASDSQRLEGEWEESLSWIASLQEQFPRGYPDFYRRWYLPSSRVCGGREGFPNRLDRLKAIGNAIPPQVAFVFLDAIRRMELEARELMRREKGSLCAA